MGYYGSHVGWLSVNKIKAALQLTGQIVIKRWFLEINLNWWSCNHSINVGTIHHKNSFYKKQKKRGGGGRDLNTGTLFKNA